MSVEFAPTPSSGRCAQNLVYNNGARQAGPRGVMLDKVKIMNAETTDQVRPAEEMPAAVVFTPFIPSNYQLQICNDQFSIEFSPHAAHPSGTGTACPAFRHPAICHLPSDLRNFLPFAQNAPKFCNPQPNNHLCSTWRTQMTPKDTFFLCLSSCRSFPRSGTLRKPAEGAKNTCTGRRLGVIW